MRGALSGRLKLLTMAWEAWRFRRGDDDAIARRQRYRLEALVRYARTASPYYRRLYRHQPSGPVNLQALTPVAKRDLMAHFDEWVTDPDITLESLKRDFLSDPALAGSLYLGRYHVVTTSGTTGHFQHPAAVSSDS